MTWNKTVQCESNWNDLNQENLINILLSHFLSPSLFMLPINALSSVEKNTIGLCKFLNYSWADLLQQCYLSTTHIHMTSSPCINTNLLQQNNILCTCKSWSCTVYRKAGVEDIGELWFVLHFWVKGPLKPYPLISIFSFHRFSYVVNTLSARYGYGWQNMLHISVHSAIASRLWTSLCHSFAFQSVFFFCLFRFLFFFTPGRGGGGGGFYCFLAYHICQSLQISLEINSLCMD